MLTQGLNDNVLDAWMTSCLAVCILVSSHKASLSLDFRCRMDVSELVQNLSQSLRLLECCHNSD